MLQANIRDCAALVKYFAWLEDEMKKPDHSIDEFTAAQKLQEIKKSSDMFLGLSFPTMSSFGPSSSSPHYFP